MKTPPGRGPGASGVFSRIRRAGATGGWQTSVASKKLDGESLSFAYSPRGSRISRRVAAEARLEVTREQILAFRRNVGALDKRLPPGADSLRQAAWAGLQDSMPRAALLSIHARVEATPSNVLDDSSLAQVWGPRFSAYVVAAVDHPIFTLGRYPDDARGRRVADDTADRLDEYLRGRRMTDREIDDGLGVRHNSLRYATTTGRVLIRWAGARAPTIWTVPRPNISAHHARLELARRYLHVFGPTSSDSFAQWAGIGPAAGRAAFDTLRAELIAVQTPIGDAWILAADEAAIRSPSPGNAPARLLPSGDPYYLLQGADRELLVADPRLRSQLWTSRVWPGALLVNGEISGTWRRAQANVIVEPWRRLSAAEVAAVEAEASGLPLPGLEGRVRVNWLDI